MLTIISRYEYHKILAVDSVFK